LSASAELLVLWAKGLNANEIHSEMHPVYGDKCFWADEENARWAEICIRYRSVSVVRQWLGQQPASFFASGIQKLVDRWDKCLNELGQYVENTNV